MSILSWVFTVSYQSILKESTSEYSLEGLTLKLKLQYFDHLMQRADSLEKTLMLGKIEGRRRRGWQSMRWLDVITDSKGMTLSKLGDREGQGSLESCSPWCCKELDVTERLNNSIVVMGSPLIHCWVGNRSVYGTEVRSSPSIMTS